VGMVPEEFGWTNSYTGDYIQGSPNSYTCDGSGLPSGCTPAPVANNPIIFGNFTTSSQLADGTCVLLQADGGAGTQVVSGGNTVTYEFPITTIYNAAQSGAGTQIQVRARITRDDHSGNVCVRNYTGIGLWPLTVCNADIDCDANPSEGRPIGSGILGGIPLNCNPNLVALDPVIVPANLLANNSQGIYSCSDLPDGGSTAQPFINQPAGCGGGVTDNNGVGGTNICFYTNAAANTFPYTQ